MAIKNGNIADADEVMNVFGSLFNDIAQNIFNADYIGFDSRLAGVGSPTLKNVEYSTFTSDDAISKTGFSYSLIGDLYGATPSGTGSTEDSTTITTTSNFPGGLQTINLTAEKSIIISEIKFDADSGPGTYLFEIIQNGLTLASKSSGSVSDFSSITFLPSDYLYALDVGAFEIQYERTSGSGAIGRKNSESFSGTLFSYSSESVFGSNEGGVFITAEETSMSDTSNITVGTTVDVGEDITNIIPIMNYKFLDTNSVEVEPTLEFSNDNSTFETITNKEIHRPSTTGQKRILRLTVPSSAVFGYISEYAIKYNLY